MSIHVALTHVTHYRYDRPVELGPQVVRLRPAPHSRTPVLSYSLTVEPTEHFVNWQQDPQGNWLARLVFPQKTRELRIEVDLVAEMSVINPFDFFLEPDAESVPFAYDQTEQSDLAPFLKPSPLTPRLKRYLAEIPREETPTVDFLVALNQRVQGDVSYLIRMEPGVQSPETTLEKGSGSCRDSAWLLVQLLRNLGLAARFVSGYLIQLVPDVKSLDGPSGTSVDFTDLHAWCEVYLPGAGWVGLDATSGLFTGEGHIPLAATAEPGSAAPVSGGVEESESTLDHTMSVERVWEAPRVTKPYTDAQWQAIDALGQRIDKDLETLDVRLTMGGEPTFVAMDDPDGEEWNTAALGPTKRKLAAELFHKLRARYAPQGLVHFGQGKWYPGEQLPRWSLNCFWRRDGEPLWRDAELIADESRPGAADAALGARFLAGVAERLGVESGTVFPAYEDAFYYLWRERQLPVNVDPFDSKLGDALERKRLRKVFEQGLDEVIGHVLPITREADGDWRTGPWFLRAERCYLVPGDSPLGYRLPLDSQPWVRERDYPYVWPADPSRTVPQLPGAEETRRRLAAQVSAGGEHAENADAPVNSENLSLRRSREGGNPVTSVAASQETLDSRFRGNDGEGSGGDDGGGYGGNAGRGTSGNGDGGSGGNDGEASGTPSQPTTPRKGESADTIVRRALCAQARGGILYLFMPPVDALEDYLELVTAIEATAAALDTPVLLEGYEPPRDPRIEQFRVTPDPGVIEANIQPAARWDELVAHTTFLYDTARETRLITEKFMLDGRHTGTGGGNHITLGALKTTDSPFLRRPDLLRSMLSYWHNHPALSFAFSGLFIGPTSQSPRVDEARNDSVYELEIAFRQMTQPDDGEAIEPWKVDRLLRNLLIDATGNTHRAEFCIDKLYSPDSASGRLGLLEMRGFEMPPHARMSLTQQLLIRALIARFWKQPYAPERLVRWGTELHDRFMLEHFVRQDLADVLAETREAGYAIEPDWFDAHLEFRFPKLGAFDAMGIEVELRHALEPWHVLGEEGAVGGTVRFVDASLERLQVKVTGMSGERYALTCNGRRVPLTPTGNVGEYVAGVRYKAWQPPSGLHPTIPAHAPLTFDLVDTWMGRSMGGCQYHVAHPGGRNFEDFPVNAYAAESRRLARFFRHGHTPGKIDAAPAERNPNFPFTLDLRR